jgi:hypothetical protein
MFHTVYILLLLSLAPQPRLGLGLLHKIRLNFVEASQQFSFLQGRVVSPTPNPHPGGPGLYLYLPEAGWLLVLVASYDTHGLRWDYSYSPVTTRRMFLFLHSVIPTWRHILQASINLGEDVHFVEDSVPWSWNNMASALNIDFVLNLTTIRVVEFNDLKYYIL